MRFFSLRICSKTHLHIHTLVKKWTAVSPNDSNDFHFGDTDHYDMKLSIENIILYIWCMIHIRILKRYYCYYQHLWRHCKLVYDGDQYVFYWIPNFSFMDNWIMNTGVPVRGYYLIFIKLHYSTGTWVKWGTESRSKSHINLIICHT